MIRFSILLLAGAFLAGCGSGESTPDDEAFQKQFAEAAAKQKGQPAPSRSMKPPTNLSAGGTAGKSGS